MKSIVFMISGSLKARLGYLCPLDEGPGPGNITRVGGHRRQPVLNPAMHKASDAGHIAPQACGVALALAIVGRAKCRRPPPEAKNGSFLKSARCA